ncbi:MAG: SUMF1/EgtB/PvdO family nonheme iron enzyme, partial [Planctomycetes bacterium]|nr:SUMF1/EgtB/PvdO family nonheme iron enzyme [Planctomycetota bacterium]
PTRFQTAVPRDLETICLKCLEKDASKRYATAGELADDLRRFLEGVPITARPVSTTEHVWRWARRNKAIAASLAGIALLLLATTIGSMIAAGSFSELAREKQDETNAAVKAQGVAKKRQDEAIVDQGLADEARREAEDLAEISEQRAYASEMTLASSFATRHSGLPRLRELVDEWIPAAGETDRRGWEWHYLKSLAHREVALLENRGGAVEITWGLRSKAVLTVSSDGRIESHDVSAGRVNELATSQQRIQSAAWSADRTLLAAACLDGRIRVWNMKATELLADLPLGKGRVRDMGWHATGRWLAVFKDKDEAIVWDWPSREIIHRFNVAAGHKFGVSWHPQKPLLAVAQGSEFVITDVTSGEVQCRLSCGRLYGIRWSPDGRRIAAALTADEIDIWDMERQEVVAKLTGYTRMLTGIAWNPRGDQLAASLRDNTVRIWDAAHGALVHTLRGHLDTVEHVAWSPDGRFLVSSGYRGGMRVWDSALGTDDLVRPLDSGCCRWLPHPDQIAVSEGSTLEILDATTGKTVESWTLESNKVIHTFVVDSTGKQVAYRDVNGRIWISDRGDSSERLVLDEGTDNVPVSAARRRQWIAWSPDDSLVAAVARDQQVGVWDASTGSLVARPPKLSDHVLSLAWSPDGQTLAYGGLNTGVALWDAKTRKELRRVNVHGYVDNIHWKSDGTQLLRAGERDIEVIDIDKGQIIQRLKGPASRTLSVTATPDGSRIAAASYDAVISIWDGNTGNIVASFQAHPIEVCWVRWNGDETRLASLAQGDALRVYDAQIGLEQAGDPRALARLIRRLEDGSPSSRQIEMFREIAAQPSRQDEVIAALEAAHSRSPNNNQVTMALVDLLRGRAESGASAGRLKEAEQDDDRADALLEIPPWSLPADAPAPAVAPFDAATAKRHQEAWADYLGVPVETTDSIGMKLVLVPPGEFLMGSSEEELASLLPRFPNELAQEHLPSEGPQHRVRITRPLYLGRHEVTVGQFRAFVEASGYKTEAESDGQGGRAFDETNGTWRKRPEITWRNPGFEQTDDHPVVQVTWNDCVAFCQWLSDKEGTAYAPPTEAQWEYACRSGSTTRWCFGDDKALSVEYAWCGQEGGNNTQPVGRKAANGFGLFDVHGNAREWCADWYGKHYYGSSPADDPVGPAVGSDHTSRGGGWCYSASTCRSATRVSQAPSNRGSDIGFRVVLALADATADVGGPKDEGGRPRPDQTALEAKETKIEPKP